ncbi:hypothetical protein TNCV_2487161 [Trichonephila clavipes]|uniref:Uncharacterized protein n=1 Tax=Trichonephila clavipes TaxID=2585209 RepID=A0A8X6W0A3_TRICX|nr:hypothetical protein TNCV_2487161 [Trichonephila clavipes]
MCQDNNLVTCKKKSDCLDMMHTVCRTLELLIMPVLHGCGEVINEPFGSALDEDPSGAVRGSLRLLATRHPNLLDLIEIRRACGGHSLHCRVSSPQRICMIFYINPLSFLKGS